MRRIILLATVLTAAVVIGFICTNCRSIRRTSGAKPVPHDQLDRLLKKHVGADGMVDYRGLQRDSAALDQYLRLLESAHPDAETWSREEQMAYWINAYNAYTLRLILRHYPVASIKDIKNGVAFVNSVWDIRFIRIQGHTYDLNNIEHNILRPVFRDARIHAAVNCASFSCPKLRPEAYTAARLDRQLDEAMREFINDPLRNRISPEKTEVSEIFKWFRNDFERDAGSVPAFINRFSANKIAEKVELKYINYDWRLNDR